MNKFLLLVVVVTVGYANLNHAQLLEALYEAGGLACEEKPTGALCLLQNLTNHLPTLGSPFVSCNIFVVSGVHCCDAFCRNSTGGGGGHCDPTPIPLLVTHAGTGACFCDKPDPGVSGLPYNCPVLTFNLLEDPVNAAAFDARVAAHCQPLCNQNPNGCTSATYVTAGPLGTVCMCYCPVGPP